MGLALVAVPAAALDSGEDLYDVLGVDPGASQEDLRRAYRRQSMNVHPDKCPGSERERCEKQFITLARAFEALSDAGQRGEYDRLRASSSGWEGGGGGGGPKGDDCWGQGFSWEQCCDPRTPVAKRAACWDGWYTEANCCGPRARAEAQHGFFKKFNLDRFDFGSAARTFAGLASTDPSLRLAMESLARYAAGRGIDWERITHGVGERVQAKLREKGKEGAANWVGMGREAWAHLRHGNWEAGFHVGQRALSQLGAHAGEPPPGGAGGEASGESRRRGGGSSAEWKDWLAQKMQQVFRGGEL